MISVLNLNQPISSNSDFSRGLTAFGFMLSGITVLPIFGFIFAVPLLMVSFYFFSAHLKKDCQIKERAK